jgi:cullin-associated NEDD8-dissociated protein 1
MTSTSYLVAGLLDKMQKIDSDFRFMAVRDLLSQLELSSFKLDSPSEQKVVEGLLKALSDSNSEVQTLAQKCLVPLSFKVNKPENLQKLLMKFVESASVEMKDISTLSMKTFIQNVKTQDLKFHQNLAKNLYQNVLVRRNTDSLGTS